MHLPMYACILPDLSYQFATQEYLGMLGWQGDVTGVPLARVHAEETLFELRHAINWIDTQISCSRAVVVHC